MAEEVGMQKYWERVESAAREDVVGYGFELEWVALKRTVLPSDLRKRVLEIKAAEREGGP